MLKRYYTRLWARGYGLGVLPIAYCLLPIACILFLSGCASKQIAETEIKTLPWETYLFNKERQGRTEDTMAPPPQLSTSFMIASAPVFKFFIPYEPVQNSSPAIVDNTVYVGSSDKYFYAIDLLRGKKIWEFATTGAVESSPTVAAGRVYFGTSDGILYCLDRKDGRELWRFQARAEILSSPIVTGDIVYLNSADDKLYALKAETGEKLWQYTRAYVKNIVKRTYASPAVYEDKVYCNFAHGYIVALEKTSGREIWQKKVAGEDQAGTARFTPTIDNGFVYLINGDGILLALDAKSGEEKWRFDIIKIADFAIGSGYLFIAGYDGSIIAMKKTGRPSGGWAGEIVWRRRVSQGIPASLIAADKYLIVASNYKMETSFSRTIGSSVDIFDMDQGERVWNENIDSTTSTALAVAYNHLLLVTDTGYLRIYKSQTQD